MYTLPNLQTARRKKSHNLQKSIAKTQLKENSRLFI